MVHRGMCNVTYTVCDLMCNTITLTVDGHKYMGKHGTVDGNRDVAVLLERYTRPCCV